MQSVQIYLLSDESLKLTKSHRLLTTKFNTQSMRFDVYYSVSAQNILVIYLLNKHRHRTLHVTDNNICITHSLHLIMLFS